jgi:hypothetical protein
VSKEWDTSAKNTMQVVRHQVTKLIDENECKFEFFKTSTRNMKFIWNKIKKILFSLIYDKNQQNTYQITSFVFLRALGFVYTTAFLGLALQGSVLFGPNGLLPADKFLRSFAGPPPSPNLGLSWETFARLPTVFWASQEDSWLSIAAWSGVVLAVAMTLGFANAISCSLLWMLYMSFVHIGQDFYSFGWDILLLETGFLAVFLCPLWDPRPFPTLPPPRVVFWLLRWLTFRIYLGAGMIKVRSDPCWTDLTCLIYHYETQPIPNPLSWLLHQAPPWFHKAGVLWNHITELVVPFFLFAPRFWRITAALLLGLFQVMLILSGNLSFLNWLTLTVTLGCFDDAFYIRLIPRLAFCLPEHLRRSRIQVALALTLTTVVLFKSRAPVLNLFASRQIMNGSFDALHLVNTYGAFGAVGKTRDEVILEGTSDPTPSQLSLWMPYEFLYKPGDIGRRPPVIAPYQPRIDWQIWFAAMATYNQHPWLIHLTYKLLNGDPEVRRLIAHDPFASGGEQVRFIRARLYRYRFTKLREDGPNWWNRELVGEYFPPLSLDNPSLTQFLRLNNLID